MREVRFFLVTRHQSIDNFSNKADDLIGCAYLLSASRISAMLKAIASSHLLCEIISYCIDGEDFEEMLMRYSLTSDPYPTSDTKELIAFGFQLFTAVDCGDIDLLEVLNHNYKRSNPERSYQTFCAAFVLPFKVAIVDTAERAVEEYDIEVENEKAKKSLTEQEKTGEIGSDCPLVFVRAEEEDGSGRKNYLTCFADIQSLVSEERAKIISARLRDREKKDLLMLLDSFRENLYKGTKESLKQSFVSYKYAVQNFKRVESDIDDIGRILRFCGIID